MENEACAQAKIYSFCIRDGISFNWIFAGEHARDFALFSLQAIIADANFSSRSFFFVQSKRIEGGGFIDLRRSV